MMPEAENKFQVQVKHHSEKVQAFPFMCHPDNSTWEQEMQGLSLLGMQGNQLCPL